MRGVIHDQVGHQVPAACQFGDIVPGAESGIGLCVIDRVESRVRAVDGSEERKQMRAAEQPGERSIHQRLEFPKAAARQAIDVGYELDLVSDLTSWR